MMTTFRKFISNVALLLCITNDPFCTNFFNKAPRTFSTFLYSMQYLRIINNQFSKLFLGSNVFWEYAAFLPAYATNFLPKRR